MDRAWWDIHRSDVLLRFKGERYSSNPIKSGVTKIDVNPHGNSGAGAIALAAKLGAKRIILLGYDCQHTNGQAHWHGNHPKGLGNAGSTHKWPAKFQGMADELAEIDILNASRETALKCWPRIELEKALAENA